MKKSDPAAREVAILGKAQEMAAEYWRIYAPSVTARLRWSDLKPMQQQGWIAAATIAYDAAEKRAEEMAASVKVLEAALGEIAEAKAKTNAGTNVQLIWDLAAIARAALAQETPHE